MLHLPILRFGQSYESIDKAEIVHHATGEVVALVSQANSGLIVRDLHRTADDVLERFSVVELFALCQRAAELFANANLPCGDSQQSFDDYIRLLSATTGMPVSYCRNNAEKVRRVLAEIDLVVRGLTRGFDLSILDRGYGENAGSMLSYFRAGRRFGVVLPSNSPGVHSLWIPAIALKAPVALKPGREEPWTPLRVIEALSAAGVPREAFGFYPTDHAGSGELLRNVDRGMVFGDTNTTRPWVNDPRIEVHGPGFSKIVLGDDTAEDWEKYLDVIEASIAANGGRSCINASGVWTPRHGWEIAEALAERFAKIEALPAEDPQASVAAFANPRVAEAISVSIDAGLHVEGAIDVTRSRRGTDRLVRRGRLAWLLPTVVRCDDREHPLVNREFLFPFASIVECPTAKMPEAIGPSLVVSAITGDRALQTALMNSPNVDRLNLGPIPTMRIAWDQPHEGNLFELLYRQRAFQTEPAA
ncbi:MAG: aldehyde dehydrogenase [Phycisphaerae bacterium]|nr:aldehyde dehydrogenase [Phycisphaerae bacterium]